MKIVCLSQLPFALLQMVLNRFLRPMGHKLAIGDGRGTIVPTYHIGYKLQSLGAQNLRCKVSQCTLRAEERVKICEFKLNDWFAFSGQNICSSFIAYLYLPWLSGSCGLAAPPACTASSALKNVTWRHYLFIYQEKDDWTRCCGLCRKRSCLICDEPETKTFHRCQTKKCKFIYCGECWADVKVSIYKK